jgi:hypothetical protein
MIASPDFFRRGTHELAGADADIYTGSSTVQAGTPMTIKGMGPASERPTFFISKTKSGLRLIFQTFLPKPLP